MSVPTPAGVNPYSPVPGGPPPPGGPPTAAKDRAIQQAIQQATDPAVRQELLRFQQTGIPPTNPATVAALSLALVANGLPPLPGGGQAAKANVATAPNQVPPAPGQAPPPATGGAGLPNDPGIGSQSGAPNLATPGGTNTSPVTPPITTGQAPPPATSGPPPAGGSTVSATPPPQNGSGLGSTGVDLFFRDPQSKPGQQAAFDYFLQLLGIDQTAPGLFGNSIASQLQGIFQNYNALRGIGGATGDQGYAAGPTAAMGDLANLVRSQGIGGVANYGKQALALLPGLSVLANNIPEQQRLMQAGMGLTAEAMNPSIAQGLANQYANSQTLLGRDTTQALQNGGQAPTDYLKFVTSQNNPAYQGIINLLQGR